MRSCRKKTKIKCNIYACVSEIIKLVTKNEA